MIATVATSATSATVKRLVKLLADDAHPGRSHPDAGRVFHQPGHLAVQVAALVGDRYLRRFDIEHTFRFLKGTLGWTTPARCTSEQADRWTLLIAAAYSEL